VTPQERGLLELADTLENFGVPYMVIGGLAAAVWGEPRATLDIDVTVWVPDPGIPSLLTMLAARFDVLVAEPAAFAARTRVVPLRTRDGVRVDLILGLLSFEEEAIRRARPVPVAGRAIRFCTPEDLILHKIISSRERDLADARAVALRRGASLDLAYLEPRVAELAALLEQPEIADRWQAWKRDAGL
jgi:hypothetical protein